jgi:hypothetical protein
MKHGVEGVETWMIGIRGDWCSKYEDLGTERLGTGGPKLPRVLGAGRGMTAAIRRRRPAMPAPLFPRSCGAALAQARAGARPHPARPGRTWPGVAACQHLNHGAPKGPDVRAAPCGARGATGRPGRRAWHQGAHVGGRSPGPSLAGRSALFGRTRRGDAGLTDMHKLPAAITPLLNAPPATTQTRHSRQANHRCHMRAAIARPTRVP